MPSASVEPPQRDGLALQRMEHRGEELDLDPDHLDPRLQGLGGERGAAHDAAAADRHDDGLELGIVVEHLEPDRALAGDDPVVVIGVNQHHPLVGDDLLGLDLAVGEMLAISDVGTMRPRPLDLVEGWSRASRWWPGCRAGRHAQATAWAWLPADMAMTPRSRSAGVRELGLTKAPRSLKELVTWRFSSLTQMSAPVSSESLGAWSRGPHRIALQEACAWRMSSIVTAMGASSSVLQEFV